MPVPLTLFRRWLKGEQTQDQWGDALGVATDASAANPGKPPAHAPRAALLWSGGECRPLSARIPHSLERIGPHATVIIPAACAGWSEFGHIPGTHSDETAVDNPATSARPGGGIAAIDIASAAFRQARGRTILRVHNALIASAAERAALSGLTDFMHDPHLPWRHSVLAEHDGSAGAQPDVPPSPSSTLRADRLTELRGELHAAGANRVHMVRYPGGFALIGPRFQRRLPRENFDDERDEQNVDADQPLALADHLADVAAETRRFGGELHLPAALTEALTKSAEYHDLGKADPRFQAMLIAAPVEIAYMQPRLLAKSARGVRTEGQPSDLPAGWRHEMLSIDLAKKLASAGEHEPLLLHCIAAHHGHARPFAPVVLDDAPPTVTLDKLNGRYQSDLDLTLSAEERREQVPPHRLDSGISARFWTLNRQYGWWGLAWLETVLRLADWSASSTPNKTDDTASFEPRSSVPKTALTRSRHELPVAGLDGSNPLGFLAALGVLRTASTALPAHQISMYWEHAGIWRPVLRSVEPLDENILIESLHTALKSHQDAPQFTALGDNINVPKYIFRQTAQQAVASASIRSRAFADFCAAYGSEALSAHNEPQKIQDTAIRTMAGAGHQHFLKTMRALIEKLTEEHLQKTLFTAWDYGDPAEALSLRFDPIDDVRYALRWRDPSGDPRRKSAGSNHGANRLAIEALPLLPALPGPARLQTTAFIGHRSDNIYFIWPIWARPITAALVPSLLLLSDVYAANRSSMQLAARGVASVMRSQRITVGKVRNFAPSEPTAILALTPAACTPVRH
ncbi:MAG: CRISPR-associated endonuclease Cas3'' [Gammaproteobacteria bacterium]|nr:CRISPR-associated endonuclease Cas3'' [Gammaproteobacteria bacterium]